MTVVVEVVASTVVVSVVMTVDVDVSVVILKKVSNGQVPRSREFPHIVVVGVMVVSVVDVTVVVVKVVVEVTVVDGVDSERQEHAADRELEGMEQSGPAKVQDDEADGELVIELDAADVTEAEDEALLMECVVEEVE